MKKSESYYISGPVTGMPDLNKPAFMIAEMVLRKQGYIVVNPIKTVLPSWSTWSDYMRVLIPLLCPCDRIYMLRGWWHSRGAWVELLIAKVLGIKVLWEEKN